MMQCNCGHQDPPGSADQSVLVHHAHDHHAVSIWVLVHVQIWLQLWVIGTLLGLGLGLGFEV